MRPFCFTDQLRDKQLKAKCLSINQLSAAGLRTRIFNSFNWAADTSEGALVNGQAAV